MLLLRVTLGRVEQDPVLVLSATIARRPEKLFTISVAEARRRLETEAMRRLGRDRRRKSPRFVVEYIEHEEHDRGMTVTLKAYID